MRNQRPRTSPFRTISRLLMILIVLLTAMPLSADSHRDPPGRLKDWSFGYSYVHLTTTAGNVYGIHSPAINFHARNGWRTPLITSISVLVPVGIRYNDEFFSGLFD